MNEIIYTLARFAVNLYPYLHALALAVGSVFAISGFTDIIFDIYFIFRSIRRFFLISQLVQTNAGTAGSPRAAKDRYYCGMLA